MDPISSLPVTHAAPGPFNHDLAEIDAAIGMVAAGIAARVRLVGLAHPGAAAPVALARTQAAGLAFEVERDPGGVASLTIGPVKPEVR